MITRVLVAGLSARAAAESAARAGFDVTALDAFSDRDQHPAVRSLRVDAPRFSARAAAQAARSIECDAVMYLSSFENHPSAVEALSRGRALWGNPPDVLRRVRDPVLVAEAFRRRGFVTPQVRLPASAHSATARSRRSLGVGGKPDTTYPSYVVSGFSRTVTTGPRWLLKPLKSGGGRGIRPWQPSTDLPRGFYLQERIDGLPASIVFVAAGGRAVPLGLSLQLAGDPAFGASGFEYCGNILVPAGDPALPDDAALTEAAARLASVAADEFGLVGVNGIDVIARGPIPYAVEVNPRWCASMELLERACDLSVAAAHAAACQGGRLPEFDYAAARRGARAWGKAIVFAREDVCIGDTDPWLADAAVRDVPRRGQRIPKGGPICTVFADGADVAACRAALVDRASRIDAAIGRFPRNSG